MLILAQAGVLSPFAIASLLATVFIWFYVDAIVFPTLPELCAIGVFLFEPTIWFAVAILLTIMLAEFLGFNTLYFIVKRVRVPRMIEKAAKKYCQFLLVSDEKVILVNRIAPVVPFVGAFAALQNWNWGKCILYTFIGGIVKYGVILALANVFYVYLSSDAAMWVTIILVLAVIAISFVWSFFRRKKMPATCDGKIDEKKDSS
ncbi:MAG: hypothetical protein LUO79_06900 [Methanomassiliicoccales archaeon]|nr:hypothetical protein [Methanomassiliicoccales archaeon]